MKQVSEKRVLAYQPFEPNPRGPTTFAVPPKACDCHAHIFPKNANDAFVTPRTYTPSEASLSAYRHMLSVAGIERGVIVQPSIYGTDNRATLKAVADAGSAFRAVVVVDGDVTVSNLETLERQGARGVRVNTLFATDAVLDDLTRLAKTLADVGWHLQMLADVTTFPNLYEFVRKLPVPVVFDHMGHTTAKVALGAPGFRTLQRLVGQGHAWVKLSGPYRVTKLRHTPYHDVTAMARELISANPENVVWGSDWPHPHISVPMPDDGDLLDMLAHWAPENHVRNRILVDNPERLYGFGP